MQAFDNIIFKEKISAENKMRIAEERQNAQLIDVKHLVRVCQPKPKVSHMGRDLFIEENEQSYKDKSKVPYALERYKLIHEELSYEQQAHNLKDELEQLKEQFLDEQQKIDEEANEIQSQRVQILSLREENGRLEEILENELEIEYEGKRAKYAQKIASLYEINANQQKELKLLRDEEVVRKSIVNNIEFSRDQLQHAKESLLALGRELRDFQAQSE